MLAAAGGALGLPLAWAGVRCAPCESIQSLRSTRINSLALLGSSISALSPSHSRVRRFTSRWTAPP